jgi:predicted TIM-barrel fold metal-dependent hydrolase
MTAAASPDKTPAIDTGEEMMASKPQVIALEEHYIDPEVKPHITGRDRTGGAVAARLDDVGQGRIADMDAAGIDIQVLSHGAPSVQRLDAELAVRLARGANDRLADTVRAHPDRFAAFAMLPTADPKAAADELERAVTRLGFKGAMVHGLTGSLFLDDKRFWPIFERAQALDVPLYLHPAIPHPAVVEAYYKDYVEKYPNLLRAAWGFTVETATQGIRMVLSDVFDTYPRLKIILGHLGEGLPFLLWRINMALVRDGAGPTWFRDNFCEHFWITTSGFFSDPALLCCVQEMGVDRILFSVDYPFVENAPGTEWVHRIPLCAEDKAKILNGNVKRLLKM